MTLCDRSAGVVTLGTLLSLLPACASDTILPVEARCGDGIVTPPEECDSDSSGCESCRIADGYVCPDNVCASVCGDGQVVGDEECDPPDALTCDESCREASRDGCSMDGYYLVRQTNYSRDTIVGQLQTSTLWYVYLFEQDGDAFSVKEVLGCGFVVTGSVTVSLDRGSTTAFLYSSHEGPEFAQGPRRGHSKRDGDVCSFDMERWYLIRGLEERFLPADFRARPALAELTPLPEEADPLKPSAAGPDGALDTDGDGRPGFALRLSGNLPGVRNAVQRDWAELGTFDDRAIVPDAVEFDTRCDFDNEERVLSVSDCDPAACGLLVAGSVPAKDIPGHATFRYLGQGLDDPRVSAIVQGGLGRDTEVDLQTCAAVQAAFPPDTTSP